MIMNDVNIGNKTYITSHRGGGFREVENTLESIEAGALMNAEYAEIDVQLTKDNRLILLHDST